MELEKLTPGIVADCSKSELIDVVMAFVNQFAQHTELSTRLNEQNALVTEENAQLQTENAAHVQRDSDLERRLGLMSGISSKPPSSDGLAKPSTKEKRTLSQRSTSNRKSGGQPGHKGTVLKQVENPDEVADHYPNQFRACQTALSPDELIRSAARQVFDLALLQRLLSSVEKHATESHKEGKSAIKWTRPHLL